jgi:hypothetical protein
VKRKSKVYQQLKALCVCVTGASLAARRPFSEGTLGDIRLRTNEVSKVKGWVIYLSKNVISN